MRQAERVRGSLSPFGRSPSPFRARTIASRSCAQALSRWERGLGSRIITNTPKIQRLTKRPQFLAVAKGVSLARGAVVVQRLERHDDDPAIGVGFTATRKVGGAVDRNRCKRRLREAARAMVPVHGVAGSDYVLIARQGTADRPWDRLLDDVKSALTRLATTPGPVRSGKAEAGPIPPDPTSTGPTSTGTPPQDR